MILMRYFDVNSRVKGICLKDFGAFVILSACVLSLVYASAVAIPFAHHDQYRFFQEDLGDPAFKQDCRNEKQYGWLYQLARPVAAELECLVFRYTDELSDLSLFRAGVIMLLAVGAGLFASWLTMLGVNRRAALFLALGMFTLPGVQHSVIMAAYANALTILMVLASYLILSAASPATTGPRWLAHLRVASRLFLSVSFLLLAMFTYTPFSFLFFTMALSVVLFLPNKNWAVIRRWMVRDIALFGLASLAFLLGTKFILDIGVSTNINYRIEWPLTSIVEKLNILISDVGPIALNLWFYGTLGILGAVVGMIILAALASSLLPRVGHYDPARPIKLPQRIERLITILLLLVASLSFWLVIPEPTILFRLFVVVGSMALLLFWWAGGLVFQPWAVRLGASGDRWLVYWAGALMLFGIVSASISTSMNVWNANREFTYIKTVLAQNLDRPIRRIHVILPPDLGVGFNGLTTYTDEFNRNSTSYWFYIPEIVRVALLEIVERGSFVIHACYKDPRECMEPKPAKITRDQTGNLVVVSERGNRSRAVIRDGYLVATEWDGLKGRISSDLKSISWENGTRWARAQATAGVITGNWQFNPIPSNRIIVTYTPSGAPIYSSANMIIIEMNVLQRASGLERVKLEIAD